MFHVFHGSTHGDIAVGKAGLLDSEAMKASVECDTTNAEKLGGSGSVAARFFQNRKDVCVLMTDGRIFSFREERDILLL